MRDTELSRLKANTAMTCDECFWFLNCMLLSYGEVENMITEAESAYLSLKSTVKSHISMDDTEVSRLEMAISLLTSEKCLFFPECISLTFGGVENMYNKASVVYIFSSKSIVHVVVSHMTKEDTVLSGLKKTNAVLMPGKFLFLPYEQTTNMYLITVVYVFSSEFIVRTGQVFMDIPEHCMRNVLRNKFKIMEHKSHSPPEFAGENLNFVVIILPSKVVDVNIQNHKAEQECLLLRNLNDPGIANQAYILKPDKDVQQTGGGKSKSVKNASLTNYDTVNERKHSYKCLTDEKHDIGEEGDVCTISSKPRNGDIVTSHSYENMSTSGHVGQEMDGEYPDMELSKHLCADSFQLSGAEKVIDKVNDKNHEFCCPDQNDLKPCHQEGFDIRQLNRFDFSSIQINYWVLPLLNASQRAHFKQVVCYEVIRLWTFQSCESPAHDGSWITELAASGFYSSGEEGEVSCFSCSRWYNNFLAGIPLQNAHEPKCRWRELNKPLHHGTEGIQSGVLMDFIKTFENTDTFRRRTRSNNLYSSSIDNNDTSLSTVMPHSCVNSISSGDTNDGHSFDDRTVSHERGSSDSGSNIVQEDSPDSSQLILTSATPKPLKLYSEQASGFQRSGIGEDVKDNAYEAEPRSNWDLSGASYPQFANREARIESFRHWDPDHIQKPKDLVDLGFFYSGYSDCARCFYCGLGLKYWRPNDDAAYQHARFRPKCLYNELLKGKEFIDRVQQEISQGATPSGSVPRADLTTAKSRFYKSSAVTLAKEKGWTQEYVEEAYKKLTDSQTDTGNLPFARLLSILEEIKAKKEGGAHAVPDNIRSSEASGSIVADDIEQGEAIQPLDDPGRIRLAEMEHSRLKDRMHCMFCKVARIGCVFLPCGHVVSCQDCGDKATVCILCGKHIAALANIYLS